MGLQWVMKYICAAGFALVFLESAPSANAQTIATVPQAAVTTLHIEILEGEGALNNIRQRDAREPVVQITDENHKPVSSVAVLFLIHSNGGAGATFGGQSLSFTATTGPDGIAHATGMQLSGSPGSFTIGVTATLGSIVASSVIHESNVLTALSSTSSATSEASGSTTAKSTTGAVIAHHTILGMSKLVAVTVGSAVVAGVVVGVVEATKSSGTTLTLGQGTISATVPGARGANR